MTVVCPKCNYDNPPDTDFCGKCGIRIRGQVPDSPGSSTCPQNSKDIRPGVTETLKTPIKELAGGSTFAGRYQIIEELGKGGMGRVYKVFDEDIKEKVALKLLKPEIASDRETIERFSNELKYARQISQRNVCRMYDLGKAEGTYFITMEYVPGEDLKTMIRMSTGLTVGTVLSVGKQVCDGLAEAHSLGVVHRDLKPQNIMIDKGGNAKVMDFGIARSIREKGITGPSVLIGTPEYMSPEQAEAKEVDHRSDIYSLGIILYEMATGRVPFEGDTALSIAMKHKGEIPKSPKQANPNIPDNLSGVILKCLEKDKARRYQSAGEIRSELEKIEKGIPTTEVVVPKPKSITSKEITVKFSLRKLLFPGLLIVALVAAAVILWRVLPRKEAISATSAPPSIAVLPFEDLSPKPDYKYLCEGIPETLINALNSIGGLRVPARTSAFSFAGKERDVREIGQKLNVETVLEGSVQVVDNNLQVTARLINVKDGYQLWSNRYSRILQDVYAIQDDIAQAIVKALKIELLGVNENQLVKRYTENIEAYNLYLQGRYFFNRRTEEDIKKSIQYFERAIVMDTKFALAYSGLADSFTTLPDYSMSPPKNAHQEGKKAALIAVELDDSLAEAHTSLGEAYDRNWEWKKAETEYKKAISLNTNYPPAHHWYALSLTYQARHTEAIAEIKRALDLDPYSLVINRNLGLTYYYARRYDEALEQLKKTAEMDPDFSMTHSVLGLTYAEKGLFQEAEQAFRKETAIPDHVRMAFVYSCNAKTGDREKLKKYLEQNIRMLAMISPYWVAFFYAELKEADKVFEWLDKAYETRDGWIRYLKVSPSFDNVRSDPRSKILLEKIGLEK